MTNQTKQATPMCMCGAPWTLRTVHLADNPCFVYEPVALSSATPAGEGLREALAIAREYVEIAAGRMYDGTNGHGIRTEAKRRLAVIDAALAASPVPMSDTGAQPESAVTDSVSAIEAAVDAIEAKINEPREPGWSYRNTITTNRNVVREECQKIRAALASQPPQSALAQQVAQARADMASWSVEKRASVQLEGSDPFAPPQSTGAQEAMRKHVEDFATKAGWKREDGEGAFEFVQRVSYRQGWEDGRNEAFNGGRREAQPPNTAGGEFFKQATAFSEQPQSAPQDAAEPSALFEAARFASDVLAETYAKYQRKIGPFASQAQLANVKLRAALSSPQASQSAPGEAVAVTDEMCRAYLQANTMYWQETDSAPATDPSKWRNGTVLEATRRSLQAALATTHSAPVAGMTLTDEEILKVALSLSYNERHDAIKFARAIEAAMREKAGGK